MLLISHVFFFSSLVILMREDYLNQMVSVKYIIAFMAAVILIGLSSSVFSLWIYNTVVNLSVLFFLLLTIQVYYRLRYKQNNLFIDRLLGKADVLFFMALGFIFSPVNYLVTLSFLSLFSILVALPVLFKKGLIHMLPLISYMGFALLIEFALLHTYELDYGHDTQLISFWLNG